MIFALMIIAIILWVVASISELCNAHVFSLICGVAGIILYLVCWLRWLRLNRQHG